MTRASTVSVLAMLLLGGAAAASAAERASTVAVFPVENLSGRSVPGDQVGRVLADRLMDAGVGVLPAAALDEFMTRHRVRYAAGIDAATARLLSEETGADRVVIASVELYSDAVPPKVGLTVRLVSLQGGPIVTWADDVGLAGNDAPGWLDLGIVNDCPTLLTRALDRLARSLVDYVTSGKTAGEPKPDSKFRPKYAYQGLSIERGQVFSVAVLPFYNVTDRPDAGAILALLFARHLSAFDAFRVVDPGQVRQQLLQGRVIMNGGVSLSDAELVGDLLDADLLVGGRVLYYQDYEGAEGTTHVEFSTVVIDRRTRKVVWSSHSYNEGQDGVRFFGRGRSTSAHAMATQMVRLTSELIASGRKQP